MEALNFLLYPWISQLEVHFWGPYEPPVTMATFLGYLATLPRFIVHIMVRGQIEDELIHKRKESQHIHG